MRNDYVTQLMTGRMDDKGKFTPFKVNPNTPITDIIRSSNKTVQEVMVKESLWLPLVDIDKTVHLKNHREKAELKELKLAHKKLVGGAGFNPNKRLNITAPTTIKV